jgi:hypothetical protein
MGYTLSYTFTQIRGGKLPGEIKFPQGQCFVIISLYHISETLLFIPEKPSNDKAK